MKRHNIFTKPLLAFSALLLASALTPFCLAQTPAPTPQVYWVTVTQVKPGLGSQYREFIKNETLPAFKKAGGKEWQTYVVAAFGEVGEFWTLRPVENLKQFDEPNFITKALGEAGARAWNAKRAQMIVSSRSFLITSRPELSSPLPVTETVKIGVGARVSVAPARAAEYEKGLKENLLPLVKKTNAKGMYINRVGLGGNPHEYLVFVPFDSFEEIGKFAAARNKAAAELKTPPAVIGLVLDEKWAVYRFVQELSVAPTPQKTASQ